MKISIILANPNQNSFCHAIAEACINYLKTRKCSIFYHDLYLEDFPAILPQSEIAKNAKLPPTIKKHCNEIRNAEGIIIIHPNWWGQPPAILKGWIDRVIRPGVAYEFKDNDSGEGIPIGLLRAKFAAIFNTSNTSTKRELEVFKDPLELIWNNCVFDLCGVKKIKRKMFNVMITSTKDERMNWLQEVEQMLKKQIETCVS